MSEPELDCTCAHISMDPYPLTMRRADPECPAHGGDPEDGVLVRDRERTRKRVYTMDERVKQTIREAILKDIQNDLDNPEWDSISEILGNTDIPKDAEGYELQEHLDYAHGVYAKVKLVLAPDEPEPCSCCDRGNFIGHDVTQPCRREEHTGCGHAFVDHKIYGPQEPVR